MKQQPDYFNHFQSMGFREIYRTPNDSKSNPKLDYISYRFISPDYDWNVYDEKNPYWPAPDPIILSHYNLIPYELQAPWITVKDNVIQTNLTYHNFNVPDVEPNAYDKEVRRDGTLKTQIYKQEYSGLAYTPSTGWGNPHGNFPYELKRVMLKVRYLKDVYDINKIKSDIKTAAGETYTKEEFFERFGNYLVPVRDDGEYIGIAPHHRVQGVSGNVNWGEDTTIKSIAIPIDSNNNFYTPKKINEFGYVEPDSSSYGLYTVENNGCIYPFLNLFGYQAGFYPSELAQISTLFPSSLINGREYDYRKYTYDEIKIRYELGDGGPFHQWSRNNEENPDTNEYAYYGLQIPSSVYYEYEAVDYTNNYGFWKRYTNYPITLDYSLYYEDELTTGQRMIFFDYNGNREYDYFETLGLNSCIFNQRELENYFKAFGVEFVYMFDDVKPLPEDFIQGRKVRHPSLINQPATLEFSKQRHQSLINQPATQAVKKVRHIL